MIRSVTQSGKQSGFSMIELLVAVLIGLFILIGMAQINLSSKKTYQTANYLSGMHFDLRSISYDIGKLARRAGYRSESWKSNRVAFPPSADFNDAGQIVNGRDGATPDDPLAADDFILRYQGSGDGEGVPDGLVADCIGQSVDANDQVAIRFAVLDGALQCTTNNETLNTTKTVALVENVENMQVVYGIDTDSDSYANHYIPANQVIDWLDVVSLRIALLLKSEQSVYNHTDNRTILLNDVAVPAVNDRYMRLSSHVTITLRNLLP